MLKQCGSNAIVRKSSSIILLYFLSFGFMYGLVGSGSSPFYEMDTLSPQVSLLHPLDGTVLYSGDLCNILWIADDTNLDDDSVGLWYSFNEETDYLCIAQSIENDGSYIWEIPDVEGNEAFVKLIVSDSFGNTSICVSSVSFTNIGAQPQAPTQIMVQSSNGIDIDISWQEVVSDTNGAPIIPDGYLIMYSEMPFEDDQNFIELGMTDQLTYTHYNVLQNHDHMLYRVVAYIDYGSRSHNQWIQAPQPRRKRLKSILLNGRD